MIVYIESNFVLEIAFDQEQATSAKNILALAEAGKIRLMIPIFALLESYQRVLKAGRERDSLHDSLAIQLNQLRRAEMHKSFVSILEPVMEGMREAQRKETALLTSTVEQLLTYATCIEMTQDIFVEGWLYQNRYYGFKFLNDAIIYAAITNNLRCQDYKEIKCFISRDTKAFNDPEIKSELHLYTCRYLPSFTDALNFIQNNLP